MSTPQDPEKRGLNIPHSSRAKVLAIMREHYLKRGHSESEWLALQMQIKAREVGGQ